MYRVFILTDREVEPGAIPWAVESEGLSCDAGTELELDMSWDGNLDVRPEAVLLDLDSLSDERARMLASYCRELGLPVLALMSVEHLISYDQSLNLDDFILQPFRPGELIMRLNQAIFRIRGPRNQNVIRVGDLLINLERYEVSLLGRKVLLTYKEYQLLVLLASTPGRVYTRDNLLSQVWGYDYFGGTRTVDVHIRRLRSKIEDASHSFIETIWNVGYRFNAGGLG